MGIQLEQEQYYGNYQSGKLNDLECDLLCLVSNYVEDDEIDEFFKTHNFENTDENIKYLYEFDGLLVSDAEYSFLVYEGYKLN